MRRPDHSSRPAASPFSSLGRRRSVPLFTTLAATLILAGCGEVDETAPATDDDADIDASATVNAAESELGEVLVDAEGLTLYMFDPDEQGQSTCYDECADDWPPLLDEEPEAGDGVDGGLLGTTERDDGEAQVTYDDWPLYHWAADNDPGDATGQGVEDVWWVLDADGTPLREATDDADDDTAPAY